MLPPNSNVYLVGAPGSGKRTMGYHFLPLSGLTPSARILRSTTPPSKHEQRKKQPRETPSNENAWEILSVGSCETTVIKPTIADFVKIRNIAKRYGTRIVAAFDRNHKEPMCIRSTKKSQPQASIHHETSTIVMDMLGHKGINRMLYHYYIVSQLAMIDLESLLQSNTLMYNEKKSILFSLIESVHFLHKHNIVHRDLRPNQIGFIANEFPQPKLLDMKNCLFVKKGSVYYEQGVADPRYSSYELMIEASAWELKRADMWAIGVIGYEMFFGCYPFGRFESLAELKEKIQKGKWNFPGDMDSAKPDGNLHALIANLLDVNPRARLTARQALVHPFFVEDNDDDMTLSGC